MKILKFTLFNIVCNVFFIGGLGAQPILIPINPFNTSPCPEEIPDLEIYSIDKIHEEKIIYFDVEFNENSYTSFDYYELQMAESPCLGRGRCPIDFIKVPFPPICYICPVNLCYVDDMFRVMVICNNKDTLYSNVIIPEQEYCSEQKLRVETNEYDFTVTPQPASNYIKVKNNNNEIIDVVSIYSIEGKRVLHNVNKNSTSILKVELPKLPTGAYITKIKNNNGKNHFKRIVIH